MTCKYIHVIFTEIQPTELNVLLMPNFILYYFNTHTCDWEFLNQMANSDSLWVVKWQVVSFQVYSPIDCGLPASSVHGIFQGRVLEWVGCHFLHQGIFLTQGSNQHPRIACVGRRILYYQATWAAHFQLYTTTKPIKFHLKIKVVYCPMKEKSSE